MVRILRNTGRHLTISSIEEGTCNCITFVFDLILRRSTAGQTAVISSHANRNFRTINKYHWITKNVFGCRLLSLMAIFNKYIYSGGLGAYK